MNWRVLIVSTFVFFQTLTVLAQQTVPGQMNYQGRLLDAQGQPLPDGDYTLTFRIYDREQPASDETLVWGPQVFDGMGDTSTGHGPRVSLADGLFNINLGPNDEQDRELHTAFINDASSESSIESRYLEVQVGQDQPIVPRQRILSAPFAYQARHADTAAQAAVAAQADRATVADTIESLAVGSAELNNDAVTSAHIADGQIQADDLSDGSVTSAKLVGDAVTTVHIADGQVQANDLSDGSVTSAKLVGDAVTSAHIADGQIQTGDLSDGSVTSAKLVANAVTSAHIADGQIQADDLSDGAITPAKFTREIALFWDHRSPDTGGGASIEGIQTRQLNNEQVLGTSISRSGNEITLQPGTYLVEGSAPAFGVHSHQVYFWDVSQDAAVILGTSEWAGNPFFNLDEPSNDLPRTTASRSFFQGIVVVSGSQKTFEVRHYTQLGVGTPGDRALGVPTADRQAVSIYTQLKIERIK